MTPQNYCHKKGRSVLRRLQPWYKNGMGELKRKDLRVVTCIKWAKDTEKIYGFLKNA